MRRWAWVGAALAVLCCVVPGPASAAAAVDAPAAYAGVRATDWRPAASAGMRRTGTFALASFNVLGAKHTRPGGSAEEYASARKRMRWAHRLLRRQRVQVVGFQELQAPQRRVFLGRTEGRWGIYSAPRDPDNSIAWRQRRWRLVSARTFTIPYFDGHRRRMPIVRLRDRRTGRDSVFVNVHNPADTGRYRHQERYRQRARLKEYRVVNRLRQTERVRVFLTGDFNERRDAFCALTRDGLMYAAVGGRHGPRCEPPAYRGIDWIFGTRRRAFVDHRVVDGALVARTTDHPLVVATVVR